MCTIQRHGVLDAPESYWLLTPRQKEEICNSAGPKGYGWTVPDTLWGLDCTPCFDIHDYCYFLWDDSNGKDVADRMMKDNLYRFIDKHTKKGFAFGWLRFLRKRRAYKYYLAVKIGGDIFFKKED